MAKEYVILMYIYPDHQKNSIYMDWSSMIKTMNLQLIWRQVHVKFNLTMINDMNGC